MHAITAVSGFCKANGTYWEGPNLCPPSVNGSIIQPPPAGFIQCDNSTAQAQWRCERLSAAALN